MFLLIVVLPTVLIGVLGLSHFWSLQIAKPRKVNAKLISKTLVGENGYLLRFEMEGTKRFIKVGVDSYTAADLSEGEFGTLAYTPYLFFPLFRGFDSGTGHPVGVARIQKFASWFLALMVPATFIGSLFLYRYVEGLVPEPAPTDAITVQQVTDQPRAFDGKELTLHVRFSKEENSTFYLENLDQKPEDFLTFNVYHDDDLVTCYVPADSKATVRSLKRDDPLVLDVTVRFVEKFDRILLEVRGLKKGWE